MIVATFPQTISNSLKTPFRVETFFVLKFNAKINPVTIALKSNNVCFFLQTKLNKKKIQKERGETNGAATQDSKE